MIHRLTLDTAVTEFLRTHQDGARMLLQYMSSVPADAVDAPPVSVNPFAGQCLDEFHRQRETAVRKAVES